MVWWGCFWLGSLSYGHSGAETPYVSGLCLSLNHWVSKLRTLQSLRPFQTISTRSPLCQLFIWEGLDFLCVLQQKQHNRWNIEAHVRIQLSSIKLDTKESYKNATFVTRFFWRGSIWLILIKTLFIPTFKVFSIYNLCF